MDPQPIVLEVVETRRNGRAASATKPTKPARLSTDVEPEYITNGEKIGGVARRGTA